MVSKAPTALRVSKSDEILKPVQELAGTLKEALDVTTCY